MATSGSAGRVSTVRATSPHATPSVAPRTSPNAGAPAPKPGQVYAPFATVLSAARGTYSTLAGPAGSPAGGIIQPTSGLGNSGGATIPGGTIGAQGGGIIGAAASSLPTLGEAAKVVAAIVAAYLIWHYVLGPRTTRALAGRRR